MTVIKLPKTPAKAFNPKRPASTLLLSQIEHLEQAVGREPKRIKRTEGQAAKYIAQLTAELLRGSQQAPATPPSRVAGAAPVAAAPVAAAPAQAAQLPAGAGTKKAATTAHAKFNETLQKRVKSKRKTPKKKPATRRRTR